MMINKTHSYCYAGLSRSNCTKYNLTYKSKWDPCQIVKVIATNINLQMQFVGGDVQMKWTVADVPLKILPHFEKGEPQSKLEHFKLFSVHLNVSNSWPEVDWRSFHVKFPPPSCWRGRAIVGFSSNTLPLQLGKGAVQKSRKNIIATIGSIVAELSAAIVASSE